MKAGFTVHCIVKNEERFVWYALQQVLPYAEEVLVFDTGSTDKTAEIIKSIESPKLIFEEKGTVDREQFSGLRREQIARTKTEWFLVLDGDEVWTEKGMHEFQDAIENAPEKRKVIVTPFKNFIDDVFTLQDPSCGDYMIAGKKAFHTVRGLRMTIPGLTVAGEYGVEGYRDGNGVEVQHLEDNLFILKTAYYHASNLVRSASLKKDWEIPYRRAKVFAQSEKCPLITEERSEVEALFAKPTPVINVSPLKKKSIGRQLLNTVIKMKRKLI